MSHPVDEANRETYVQSLEARIQELEARLKGDNDGRDPYIADREARIVMTDLERVREAVSWSRVGEEAFDAHLKEDAEREDKFRQGAEAWRVRLEAYMNLVREKEAELREQGGLLTEQVMYMDNELTELREQNTDLLAAIRRALNELGVPNEDTSAPVANAVAILTAATQGEET